MGACAVCSRALWTGEPPQAHEVLVGFIVLEELDTNQ